jgi:hypothetical protein
MPDQPVVLINAFDVPPDDGNRFLGDVEGSTRNTRPRTLDRPPACVWAGQAAARSWE